jgi:hypothetical protein
LATNVLPGREKTSSMARRTGALVAINGDYSRPSGSPVHLFAQDARLMKTPSSFGRNFAMDRNESQSYFGHPEPTIFASEVAEFLEHTIERVNEGSPRWRQIAMYTPASVGLLDLPRNVCSARLFPIERARLTSEGVSETRHEVDAVRCSERPLARMGGTILATPMNGPRAQEFAFPYLSPGDQVDLGWSLEWPYVADTLGGNPMIMDEGKVLWNEVSGSSSFFGRHPRTGVGVTASGNILLVVVDGRWRRSRGMTLARFARLFKYLGAVRALNLDGGGSTTMVINGNVVNHPSDRTGQRHVSSALVVLAGDDPGEAGVDDGQTPLPESASTTYGQSDPASIGGLASMLVAEGERVPASLRRIAARFDARRNRTGR